MFQNVGKKSCNGSQKKARILLPLPKNIRHIRLVKSQISTNFNSQKKLLTLIRAVVAVRRRHGLKVEDEGLLKDLVVIFIFLEVLCTVCCFFLVPESSLKKKTNI
jgi:hypothetical protein